MRNVCLCGICPDRKWEMRFCLHCCSQFSQPSPILHFIPSSLPHGVCPGFFKEDTSHAEEAWRGRLWPGLRLALVQSMPLRSQVQRPKSTDQVKASCASQRHTEVILHRCPLQQPTHTETDFQRLRKPRLTLPLTRAEVVLEAPDVPRMWHSGAGTLFLDRNRVLPLHRRKVSAVARGSGSSDGTKDSWGQHWGLHDGVRIPVVHPHRNKQLTAQAKFPPIL